MSRTRPAKIRPVEPDSLYKNTTVSQVINRAMLSGKKTVAQKQIYAALKLIEKQLKTDPVIALEDALKNITPLMEVRSRRVGGAAYQVPMPVRPRRATSLSVRWLVIEANKRPNRDYHSFAEKLAAEIMDALNNQGGAIQKKTASHKMADANKAFAHFRW